MLRIASILMLVGVATGIAGLVNTITGSMSLAGIFFDVVRIILSGLAGGVGLLTYKNKKHWKDCVLLGIVFIAVIIINVVISLAVTNITGNMPDMAAVSDGSGMQNPELLGKITIVSAVAGTIISIIVPLLYTFGAMSPQFKESDMETEPEIPDIEELEDDKDNEDYELEDGNSDTENPE